MTLQELISTCLDGQDAVALAKALTYDNPNYPIKLPLRLPEPASCRK